MKIKAFLFTLLVLCGTAGAYASSPKFTFTFENKSLSRIAFTEPSDLNCSKKNLYPWETVTCTAETIPAGNVISFENPGSNPTLNLRGKCSIKPGVSIQSFVLL